MRSRQMENDAILKALSLLENANIFLERTVHYDRKATMTVYAVLDLCGERLNFISRRGGSEVHSKTQVVVITEDVQNVHLLLEYRPHIDVSLTCEHDPKLQEYCVVVITEDVQNVHLLLEYRPHIDVSLTCEHDPKLQEYCKGKGVSLYQDFTPANSWVRHHTGLSSSEYRDALKMTGNVAPVRAVPGRTQDNNHCRRCYSEDETLVHVLGS
ncbi:hypothetical protein ANN_01742 [Periplaneta americana]|uniref:Uncharacterized protein n=1 Tax=Periplaneta americana TaxID=6978 RepID=A0ABQ8TW60_PERAM|nr:hypothetical protein ANN_01742 [Periplaneta americana]